MNLQMSSIIDFMKVLQVLNHFLPFQTAGTEVYVWALSKQLQQRNIEVAVVVPHYGKAASETYIYDSLRVLRYAEPSIIDRSLIMGKRAPDGLTAFVELLKKESPGIVHFHEIVGSNGITLHHLEAAKNYGAKVVLTFHLSGYSCRTGNLVYKEQELCDGVIRINKCATCYLHSKGFGKLAPVVVPLSSALLQMGIDTTNWNNKAGTALGTAILIKKFRSDFQKTVSLCDSLITLTNWYYTILKRNGVDSAKIRCIPQGLPFESSVATEIVAKTNQPPLRLMFLGRISPFKGLHLLIDAICELPETQVILDIYGQSDDEAYLAYCLSKTSGKENIKWKGRLSQQEVVPAMQQYDALCLCSTFSEMSPLVIQEAFAAGIPVIASNVFGNAEQIEHGVNGLLFRFNDSGSLREQILYCINNQAGLSDLKKKSVTPRAFKDVGKDYHQLYEELLYS